MRHPFDLEMSELEKVNFELEEVSDEALEQVSGGKKRPKPSPGVYAAPRPKVITNYYFGEGGF